MIARSIHLREDRTLGILMETYQNIVYQVTIILRVERKNVLLIHHISLADPTLYKPQIPK